MSESELNCLGFSQTMCEPIKGDVAQTTIFRRFSCVYIPIVPSTKMNLKMPIDGDVVGKITSKENMKKEKKALRLLKKYVDGFETFAPKFFGVSVPEFWENGIIPPPRMFSEETHLKQLIYEDGGRSLYENMNLPFPKKFVYLRPIFEALVKLGKAQFLHGDVDVQHILFNEKTRKTYLIDYTNMRSYSDLGEKVNNGTVYNFTDGISIYPPEYSAKLKDTILNDLYNDSDSHFGSDYDSDDSDYEDFELAQTRWIHDYHFDDFMRQFSLHDLAPLSVYDARLTAKFKMSYRKKELSSFAHDIVYNDNGLSAADEYKNCLMRTMGTFDVYGLGLFMLKLWLMDDKEGCINPDVMHIIIVERILELIGHMIEPNPNKRWDASKVFERYLKIWMDIYSRVFS